jgi:hypothetical protein
MVNEVYSHETANISTTKNNKLFYNAILGSHVELVRQAMANGAKPDYCKGDVGWSDSDPLDVLVVSFYNTDRMRKVVDAMPNPLPDIEIFNLLKRAGADINRRPYIWHRVFIYGNKFIEEIQLGKDMYGEKTLTSKEIQDKIDCFIIDANRILEAFLTAGADPDKPGHPHPFSSEAMHAQMTDEQANKYFSKGTRAINEAIEKGILWESQVDLLLQYTKLDEESLKAAERSNDPAMVEKIANLWENR